MFKRDRKKVKLKNAVDKNMEKENIGKLEIKIKKNIKKI